MGTVKIEIEDLPNGKVRVVMTPPAEMLYDKINAGYDCTSAEGYGMLAVRAIREESKKEGSLIIKVPRKGKI